MTPLSSTLQAHEARANFYQILDEVERKQRKFTITLRGKTKAVILSINEHKTWLDAITSLSNSKPTSNKSRNNKMTINVNNYYLSSKTKD